MMDNERPFYASKVVRLIYEMSKRFQKYVENLPSLCLAASFIIPTIVRVGRNFGNISPAI